jgi:outer membrane protein
VKKFKQSAFVVAILAGMLSLGATAWPQAERDAKPTPSARTNRDAAKSAGESVPHMVGLIDMAHVFKQYKKFDFLREDLKAQIGQSEGQAKEMA